MRTGHGITAVLRRSAAAWRPDWQPGLLIVLALLVQQLFLTLNGRFLCHGAIIFTEPVCDACGVAAIWHSMV